MKHFIPLILLLFAGCKQQMPDIPPDIMPMEEMKLILADMHIADAVAETKAQGGVNEKKLSEQYYETIYWNHNVKRDDFLKSYHFYESQPVLMDSMYIQVLNEISRREAEAGK